MKTGQLYHQDNCQAQSTLFALRFDTCKALAAKRSPTLRPALASPANKNPKHAAVLSESGISYDSPMTPVQVAKIRAERIAREKKRNQVTLHLVMILHNNYQLNLTIRCVYCWLFLSICILGNIFCAVYVISMNVFYKI